MMQRFAAMAPMLGGMRTAARAAVLPWGGAADACAARRYSVARPPGADFYELLGMPVAGGWGVDGGVLKSQWREKMALFHPDRLVGKPPAEQERGAAQSAVLNKAYETLLQPLPRALYLLERMGEPGIEETQSMEDPVLLMEVMELQEALANAEDTAAVDAIAEDNAAKLQETLAELGRVFGTVPVDADRVRQLAMRLRYWTNIEQAIKEWQPGARVELHH
ncbi:molecular chaperone [Malassezia sp. CBS 17886]|nr:molecular chaperone [Malassezia sp. CBS 17886]